MQGTKHIKIAIVMPVIVSCGARTAALRLYKGLLLDGFYAKLVRLHGTNMPMTFHSDLSNIKHLAKFDVVIYIGSISWPSHVFLKNLRMLFVHGFINRELSSSMMHGNLATRIASAILLSYWYTIRLLSTVDVYICRSYTSCKVNNINENVVILPQFVMPDEVEFYSKLSRQHTRSQDGIFRIVTYTSLADSPRLLRFEHISALSRMLKRASKRKFEIYAIDPRCRAKSTGVVKVFDYMPKQEFLKLLASSDLYLETCIDEELRNTVLEAGLFGVPVAKMTLPAYRDRQDYSDRELITATSINGLAIRIVECMNNDYYKSYYSRQIRNFIINNRLWDKVKGPLIERFKAI